MIYSVISPMGGGKTLFSTLYAKEYKRKNPNNKIYANYNILELKDFHYTPYGFLPFSELHDCLIIIDDIYALINQINGLLQIIVNYSRKQDIDIILTAQYYTFIPKSIRTLSRLVIVRYDKDSDILEIQIENPEKTINGITKYDIYFVRNAVEEAKKHYNTKEIVKFASENAIIEEIKKNSKTREDLLANIEIYTQSEQKRKKLKKELGLE